MKIAVLTDLHWGFSADWIKSEETNIILKKHFSEVAECTPDIVIISGDIMSHKQTQFGQCLKTIRRYLPSIPVLIVSNNHDMWDIRNIRRQSVSYKQIVRYHEMVCKKYNIQSLHNKPFQKDNIFIYGVDSWYGLDRPPSNDFQWIPYQINGGDTGTYLRNRFYEHEWWKHVPIECTTVIGVSHFHALRGHEMEMDKEQFRQFCAPANIIIVGHDHMACDFVNYDGKRYVNAGSDYGEPAYKILEVE